MASSFIKEPIDSKESPFNHVKMNRNLVTAKQFFRGGEHTPTYQDSREI
jgi:hypothetical protein